MPPCASRSSPTTSKRAGRAWISSPTCCVDRLAARARPAIARRDAHPAADARGGAAAPAAARAGRRAGAVADRMANRLWDYPRIVSGLADRFDLFHIVDHSYAQLVHGCRRVGRS